MLGMTAATLANLTDLGFLWFREFYLETSRVIQVNVFSTHISQFFFTVLCLKFHGLNYHELVILENDCI